jgi:hypothetical protein
MITAAARAATMAAASLGASSPILLEPGTCPTSLGGLSFGGVESSRRAARRRPLQALQPVGALQLAARQSLDDLREQMAAAEAEDVKAYRVRGKEWPGPNTWTSYTAQR